LSNAFGSVVAVIEALLRETSEHIDEARACLDNSMDFFHLKGPFGACLASTSVLLICIAQPVPVSII
jgi:hypothetical protein